MKKITIPIIGLFLSGCSNMNIFTDKKSIIDKETYLADTTYSAKSQNERIRFLIFHYTATNDASSLKILTQGDVSAHYLIPAEIKYQHNKPVIFQLVPDEKRAWHAGVSYWNGRNSINDTSLGIEIVNLGFTEDMLHRQWYPYSEQQIDLLTRVAKDIIKRYDISPDNILGHSDIAPGRKSDPGPLFPWKQLAAQGIGAWPDTDVINKYLAGRAPSQELSSVTTLQNTLAKYGYKIPQNGVLDAETKNVIIAFQMHFRPENISGTPDAQTEAIALALVEKYR